MSSEATTDTRPRAITRMWAVLQKTGRVRDEYSREKVPAIRLDKARALVVLAGELQALAGEVVREAEQDTV